MKNRLCGLELVQSFMTRQKVTKSYLNRGLYIKQRPKPGPRSSFRKRTSNSTCNTWVLWCSGVVYQTLYFILGEAFSTRDKRRFAHPRAKNIHSKEHSANYWAVNAHCQDDNLKLDMSDWLERFNKLPFRHSMTAMPGSVWPIAERGEAGLQMIRYYFWCIFSSAKLQIELSIRNFHQRSEKSETNPPNKKWQLCSLPIWGEQSSLELSTELTACKSWISPAQRSSSRNNPSSFVK